MLKYSSSEYVMKEERNSFICFFLYIGTCKRSYGFVRKCASIASIFFLEHYFLFENTPLFMMPMLQWENEERAFHW